MDKLANGLQQLSEDDLLAVVQLIHDHKTNDTYTKNDVESKSSSAQFHLDAILTTLLARRWRISCRPLHITRQPRQDAVGSMHGEGCAISGVMVLEYTGFYRYMSNDWR